MTAIETTVCPIDAYDNVNQAREILNWMEALNWATSKALKNGEHSRAHYLAGLGQYLARDWANYFDSEADCLSSKHGIKRLPTV